MLETLERAGVTAAACADTPVWSMSDDDLVSTLDAVHVVEQRLAAVKLALVREVDGRGLSLRQGATSTVAWLQDRLRVSGAAARRMVQVATAVDELPVLGEACRSGAVNGEQAQVIAEAVGKLPAEVGLQVKGQAERALVGFAGQHEPSRLRKLGDRILSHVAPQVADELELEALRRMERQAHAGRTLSMSRPDSFGRVRLAGWLDVESAAIINAALDPLTAPGAGSSQRVAAGRSATAEGRCDADAADGRSDVAGGCCGAGVGRFGVAEALAAEGLPGGAAGWISGVGSATDAACRAAIADVLAEDTTARATEVTTEVMAQGAAKVVPDGAADAATGGRQGPGRPGPGRHAHGRTGSGRKAERVLDERSPGQRRADALVQVCRLALNTGQLPDNGGDRPQVSITIGYNTLTRQLGTGMLDTGETITPEAARRLACDAHITPAILGGDGQPLDLGQTRRLFTAHLRRALVLRDRGCAFPACDRPARWCDGHHIQHWADGGPTNLNNGVLLCGHHHRLIHQGEWQVRLAADGLPEFLPPAYMDQQRTPRRNTYWRRTYGRYEPGSHWSP